MKVVKLQGGLGNQMFQYAIARALETNPSEEIYLDLDFLSQHNISTEKHTARDLELNIFKNLRAKRLSQYGRNFFFSTNLIYRIPRKLSFANISHVQQVDNKIMSLPNCRNIYLDGYFQSEKYFSKIRTQLLSDFIFPTLDQKNRDIAQSMEHSSNSVSIHIRRGDYVNLKNANQTHGVMTLEYYKQAIKILQDKLGEDIFFYIFSDDLEYVKQNFQFLRNCIIVEGNEGSNSWKDMCLMSNCQHHIIANSSFSWWGAWLSRKDGLTIAPKRWFNKEVVSFNIDDYIPSSWITIKA